jgi:ribonuclease D
MREVMRKPTVADLATAQARQERQEKAMTQTDTERTAESHNWVATINGLLNAADDLNVKIGDNEDRTFSPEEWEKIEKLRRALKRFGNDFINWW